jgi:hypothetical protein
MGCRPNPLGDVSPSGSYFLKKKGAWGSPQGGFGRRPNAKLRMVFTRLVAESRLYIETDSF